MSISRISSILAGIAGFLATAYAARIAVESHIPGLLPMGAVLAAVVYVPVAFLSALLIWRRNLGISIAFCAATGIGVLLERATAPSGTFPEDWLPAAALALGLFTLVALLRERRHS